MKEIMKVSYEWTNENMRGAGIETQYSGTTAVTLVVLKEVFVVSNVGDSRCIVFRK